MMANQIEQLSAVAAPAERVSARDLQRAALRDLVSLAADCTSSEALIEERHRSEIDRSTHAMDSTLFSAEQRADKLKEQIQQKHVEQTGVIAEKHRAEQQELVAQDAGMRQRIDTDWDSAEKELREKLQQATWLADSVLEATANQLRDESNKAKRDNLANNELFDGLENQAGALMFSYGVNVAMLPDTPLPTEDPADADAEIAHQRDRAEQLLNKLETLSAPRLLTGARPYIAAILITLAAAAAAQIITAGEPPTLDQLKTFNLHWRQIGIYTGVAVAALTLLGVAVRFFGKSQAKKVYFPLRQSIVAARHANKVKADRSQADRESRRQRSTRKRELEVLAAKEKHGPLAAKMAGIRQKSLSTQAADHAKRTARVQQQRELAESEINAWRVEHLRDIEDRLQKDIADARALHDQETAASHADYSATTDALQHKWREGLARIKAPMGHGDSVHSLNRDWNDAVWKDWTPTQRFEPTVQFGDFEVDLKQLTENLPQIANSRLDIPKIFSLPALLAFPSQASLLIQHDRDRRAEALQTLQMVMTRLLTTQPAGRVRFTIIDPVGLGQNFAGFMHLADWDDALVGGRIWTSMDHIEQRLANLTEHMETVIQKYLRNEFETIDEYNAQAGELAEPYRFLVISDFPINFTDESIRRLNSIAASGARCGVYTLIAHDRRAPLPGGVNLDDLIAHSVNLSQESTRFVWRDEVFKQFPLALDGPPTEDRLTEILTEVGQAARDANRVEVSFDTIAPTPEEFWSERADQDLHVAIGRMGATRLQMFRLGRGVAQHALIAGKTGSGKSTLLHALVTNLAMWYSPDEVEFYLVDFKKGVEFKTYATHQLPHARAIAVESDREFGLSVLQRIDAELSRRGELFRKAGVQDLASYRAQRAEGSPGARAQGNALGAQRMENVNQDPPGNGPARALSLSPDPSPLRPSAVPRTLLVIDEFQEFFSEDDKLAQESSVLLDRLVRQGRAFGIHVLLGSQTIGGSAGLARSTIGQMGVRIALQTTEADSQLILGDNNSAARLLSRPGEAIYNDQGGLVEANSPFQVAWLPDERREVFLQRVYQRALDEGKVTEPASVFEGNAPADIRQNRKLAALLQRRGNLPIAAPVAWLGDPVAIKEPTAIAFRRQSGGNALIVGQQDEQAMALVISMLISIAAQHSKDSASFVLFDGTPSDSNLSGRLGSVAAILPQQSKLVDYRAVPDAIDALHREMQRRLADHLTDEPAIFVLIYGLQRYRALRKSEDGFSFSMSDEEKKPQPDKQFSELLREGPSLGIHIITWCDTPAAVERTLERQAMREFDHRILFQMSAADSSNLIDSPAANKLGFYRALAFSEEQGVLEKFRPYAMPPEPWLAEVRRSLQAP